MNSWISVLGGLNFQYGYLRYAGWIGDSPSGSSTSTNSSSFSGWSLDSTFKLYVGASHTAVSLQADIDNIKLIYGINPSGYNYDYFMDTSKFVALCRS